MKKILLSALLLFTAIACNDDDNPVEDNYPTDGIALPEVKSALLIHSYNPLSGYSSQIPSLILEDAFPDELNTLVTVADANNFLYSPLTDSLSLNQPLEPAIAFYLNDQTVSPGTLFGDVETAILRRPVATVNHKVTSNDTAWIIDNKIKFFKDTMNANFYVATYLTATYKAAEYSNTVNLKVNAAPDFVINQDSVSVWDFALNNIDSSKTLTTPGEPFYHSKVLVRNFNEESAWGTRLGEYTPFGVSFSENDVIGTRSTPIRHYFLKPDLDLDGAFEPGIEYKAGFLTVIWAYNEDAGRYDYVNSVSTQME